MRPGGGKGKGAKFERYCCKRMSLAFSQGRRDDLFWRSAMSGGRATLKAKHKLPPIRTTQGGDISAIHPDGHDFLKDTFIECKSYANLDVVSFLMGRGTGRLSKFWDIAVEQAARFKKRHVMLIGKENNRPTFIITTAAWILDEEFGPDPFLSGENFKLFWFDDVFPRQKPRLKWTEKQTHG